MLQRLKRHLTIFFFAFVLRAFAVDSQPVKHLVDQRLPACFDNLLNGNGIHQVLQSKKDGFIWLATSLGLVRFDGYEFRYFRHDPSDPASIPQNNIYRMSEDKDGNLWLGFSHKGLSCFDPVSCKFINYSVDAVAKSSRGGVNSIHIDKENDVWVSIGYNGLSRLNKKDSSFTTYPVLTSENCPHLSANDLHLSRYMMDVEDDDKDFLWLACPEGLFHFNKKTGESTSMRGESVDTTRPAEYNARVIFKEGDMLWIGGWSSGIRSFHTKRREWRQYYFAPKTSAVYTDNIIHDMARKGKHEIWVASTDAGLGVFNIETGSFYFFSGKKDHEFLPSEFAYMVYVDNQENIWVAFNSMFFKLRETMQRVNVFPIRSYPERNHGYSTTNAAFEDSSGNYSVIGTSYEDGLIWSDKRNNITRRIPFKTTHINDDNMHVSRIIQRDSSTAWVLTRDLLYILNFRKGLLQLPPQPAPVNKKTNSNEYSSFAMDQQGDLWLTSYGLGIIRYHSKTGASESFRPGDSLPEKNIGFVEFDARNRLWFGGVRASFTAYYDDARKRTVFINESGDTCEKSKSVAAFGVVPTGDGKMLVCSESGGLIIFDCKAKEPLMQGSIDSRMGIGSDWVNAAVQDKDKNLWMKSLGGICRYSPETHFLEKVGMNDGLIDEVYELYCSPSNTIYLLGRKAYYTVIDSFHPDPIHYFTPKVTGFKINDKEINFSEALQKDARITVEAKYTYFTFTFASLDYANSDNIRYSYKLEGFDKEWIDAGSNRSANYTNLDGGNYVFKVRAGNPEKTKYSDVASVPVFIETIFFQTLWFRVFVALAVTSLIVVFYRFRTGKQREILELNNRAQLLEREKSVVQYENLVQQLNPHFLFNSLTSLSSLITSDAKVARQFVDQMSKIYRYILRSSENETVPLVNELNFAATYVKLQQTRFSQGLEVHVEVGEEYYHRKIVPVTVQNLIENAIKHNIIDAESPLVVDVYSDDDYLVVRNNLQKKNAVETSNKRGLAQMKSLYRYLSDRPIVINETGTYYEIKIPLL
jgi:ligand-binding sensor domain-containing protein